MKHKQAKSVTQRRPKLEPISDEEMAEMDAYLEQMKPTKRRKRARPPEEDGWEVVPMDEEEKAFINICIAMKQVEGARAALNEAQSRLDEKVAKSPKEVADNFRQFLLAGGTTSEQWTKWDSSKPKQPVPQKRGLRLVVTRPMVRYRLVEKDDGPQAEPHAYPTRPLLV